MKETLEKHVINKNQIYTNVVRERNGFMKNLMAYGAVLALIVISAVVYVGTLDDVEKLEKVDYNLVTIDINPSVGLMIDEDNKVVEVLSLNEDAVVAMEGLNLVGMNLDDAVDAVIDTSVEMGYIGELSEENVVNVTTYLNNEEENQALNDKVRTRIETRLERTKITALVIENGLDEELKAKADEYDISYGKMLIVSRATKLDETLDEKALVDMSIKEIQGKIKAKSVENYNKVKEYYEENKEEIQAKKNEIVETTKENAIKAKEAVIEKVENYKNLTTEEKEIIIEQKKEQIKETIEETKEALNSGTKEAIEAIRENIKNKRGN